jgi:hypothetical protein
MKDLIRQILREETSGLTDGQIKSAYSLMKMITKGYYWYTDTPEQPFKYTPNTIWLINPDTEEWMLRFDEYGGLWYYDNTRVSFSKYMNMEEYDFESFIKIWVQDVLKREVVNIWWSIEYLPYRVEDVLKNGKQLK